MSKNQFSPFAALLENNYRALLHLREDNKEILAQIVEALQADNAETAVKEMLNECDWRSQLVAAIACLVMPGDTSQMIEPIWAAIDRGSRVTPQLVVTASIIDPMFLREACLRVHEGCPVFSTDDQNVIRLSGSEMNAMSGSARMLASILSVAGQMPSMQSWAREMRLLTETVRILRHDASQSGMVAESWRQRIETQLEAYGISLRPRLRSIA